MQNQSKLYQIIIFLSVFVLVPSLIIIYQTLPQRTLLKESLSVLFVLSFCFMIGQFFLTRANKSTVKLFKMMKVIKVHKILGYTVVVAILLHPFFIVFPRFFEGAVNPIDAFFTMIKEYENSGILFGLIAWISMLILLITSFFKDKLTVYLNYKQWRVLHAVLVVIILIFSTLHSSILGRHSDKFMILFTIIIAFAALFQIYKIYFKKIKIGANDE